MSAPRLGTDPGVVRLADVFLARQRIARHVQRNEHARGLAMQFRARPDLAKSENKSESGDLVRAYLLIDAALA